MQLIESAPAPQQPTQEAVSQYKINVLHASWGLNCQEYSSEWNTQDQDAFANNPDKNKLKEDNIYSKITALCQDKEKCEFMVGQETLGDDPAPYCGEKEIKIEYRCFSFDRPWNIRSHDKKIQIDCSKQNENTGG